MFTEIVTHDTRKPLSARLQSRKVCGPYRWRPSTPGAGRGFYSSQRDALAMDQAGSSINLRLEACEPRDRTSRYQCDAFGDEYLTPVIARLPRGRGFLAGWTMGEGMCGSLDGQLYRDADDAAYAAHQLADHDAERERDAADEDFEA